MALDAIGLFCSSIELFHFIYSLQGAQNYQVEPAPISNRTRDRIQCLHMVFQQMVPEIFTAENWRIMDQAVWSQPSVAGLCACTEISTHEAAGQPECNVLFKEETQTLRDSFLLSHLFPVLTFKPICFHLPQNPDKVLS